MSTVAAPGRLLRRERRLERRVRLRTVLSYATGLRAVVATARVLGSALRNGWQHRILGLSAEAGFWQLLSLPSALLGVLGTIGYFRGLIGPSTVDTLEQRILSAATNLVNPASVNSLVKPTVHAVLHGGRAEIVSVGFLLSLWSGSSALATFVNQIAIAYDQRDKRSAVRSRLLALALYLVSMAAGVVLLPLLVIGPTEIDRIPAVAHHLELARLISITYWPIVGGLSVIALTSLYRVAPPIRHRWIAGVPGALMAGALWFAGSVGLRAYVSFTFRRTAAYGALGAPVAVLLFFYITALAVLLGAEVNAEILRRVHLRGSTAAPGEAYPQLSSMDERSGGGGAERGAADDPAGIALVGVTHTDDLRVGSNGGSGPARSRSGGAVHREAPRGPLRTLPG